MFFLMVVLRTIKIQSETIAGNNGKTGYQEFNKTNK